MYGPASSSKRSSCSTHYGRRFSQGTIMDYQLLKQKTRETISSIHAAPTQRKKSIFDMKGKLPSDLGFGSFGALFNVSSNASDLHFFYQRGLRFFFFFFFTCRGNYAVQHISKDSAGVLQSTPQGTRVWHRRGLLRRSNSCPFTKAPNPTELAGSSLAETISTSLSVIYYLILIFQY